jgi:hypothetical protein
MRLAGGVQLARQPAGKLLLKSIANLFNELDTAAQPESFSKTKPA